MGYNIVNCNKIIKSRILKLNKEGDIVMLKKSLFTLSVLVLVSIITFAEEAPNKGQCVVAVSISGENVGLIETLAKGETGSATAPLAQLNVLKVSEAKEIEGNKVIEDLKGKILFYIPTKSADNLITGTQMRGKTVNIIGKLYKDANAILVETIEGGEQEDEWDVLPVGKKSQIQQL